MLLSNEASYGELQVRVQRTVHSVKQFVTWYRQKTLKLKPAFQRNYVWSPKQRSFLIDTILRGFPLPIIILRDSSQLTYEQELEVVDGQQRLTTLLAYILPELFPENRRFTLSGLHSKQLAGTTFEKLDDDLKGRILNYELSVHVLSSEVPDQTVLKIFARLNSTGTALNDQELRNAEFQGAFKQLIEDLGELTYPFWIKHRIFSANDFVTMIDRKRITELVHRMLYGTKATTKATLDKLYREYDDEFPHSHIVAERMISTLSAIDVGLGLTLHEIGLSRNIWFYTLFGKTYDRLYGAPILEGGGKAPNAIPDSFWIGVRDFAAALRDPEIYTPDKLKALTSRSTHANSRKDRDDEFEKYTGE